MAMPGIIYIFDTGIGMKIGRTSRPIERRMKELSVVLDLKFVHAIYCHDVIGLEKELHERYRNKRVMSAPSREIFALSFADVMHIKSIPKFKGRECKHFFELTDVVRHSIAMHKRFFIRQRR